jgi:hypothetical protein
MKDLNPTTRTYPRQIGHVKPEQVAIFGPYTNDPKNDTAQFWVYIALAFAAGFLTHLLWG